WRIDL
ncbi:cytochrome C and Quinol oxidase polypeptide I family protein, partial [Vibrio parahaemolyticus V-223/04]